MTILKCRKAFRFEVLLFIAVFILCQKTSGQNAGATTFNSLDSSYFFYQQSEYPRDCKEVADQCGSVNSTGVYYIKPEGYPEPFEVYCDNTDDSSGWTVISRRDTNGIISFERNWESYKLGFGFPRHEYWIGNECLSYLTNQKKYQLLMEMTLIDGSSVNVSYNNFRIADDFRKYRLVSLEYVSLEGNLPGCSDNMVFGSCTCGQRFCGNPNTCQDTCAGGQNGEGCICPAGFYMIEEGGDCVPQEQCGCYISEEQKIVPEGDTYVNAGCTRKAICSNGQLAWNEGYECSPNAACEIRNETRQCYCNDGYSGDGETCTASVFTDCMDVYNRDSTESGTYTITPTGWTKAGFSVYCNMTDGGGWTVFQRRLDGSVDFYRDWNSYKQGFGDVDSEHWLGNDKIYYLTNQRTYQIRIDLVNRDGAPYYAKFNSFRINNEADNYRLTHVGTYSGTADRRSSPNGYALTYHRGYQFSTKDRDNDVHGSAHCAQPYHGAWWYKGCYESNLNGDYDASRDSRSSIGWYYLPGSGYNIKFSEMKIRPV